jgi:hypothetical protein
MFSVMADAGGDAKTMTSTLAAHASNQQRDFDIERAFVPA